MGGRWDAYPDARAAPGASLVHTSEDRVRALIQIDADLTNVIADLAPLMSSPEVPAATSQWWTSEVLPIVADWQLFRDHEARSWVERSATDWSAYVAWIDAIRAVRSSARSHGIALSTPDPASLPETVFERGARGRGGFGESIWTIGRALLYAAIGVTGFVGMREAWRRFGPTARPTTDKQSEPKRKSA